MTYPEAQIIRFGKSGLHPATLEGTEHYRITRGILEEPARSWKHLIDREE